MSSPACGQNRFATTSTVQTATPQLHEGSSTSTALTPALNDSAISDVLTGFPTSPTDSLSRNWSTISYENRNTAVPSTITDFDWQWDLWGPHPSSPAASNAITSPIGADVHLGSDNPVPGPPNCATNEAGTAAANPHMTLPTPLGLSPKNSKGYPKLGPLPAEQTDIEICTGRLSELIARLWPVARTCQRLNSTQNEYNGPLVTNAAYDSAHALLAPPPTENDAGSQPTPACNALYIAFSASHALHEILHRLLLSGSTQGGSLHPMDNSALVYHLVPACYMLVLSIYRALLQALQNDAIAEHRQFSTSVEGNIGPVPSLVKVRIALLLQLSEYFLNNLRRAIQSVLKGRGQDVVGNENHQQSLDTSTLTSIAELDAETTQRLQHLREMM